MIRRRSFILILALAVLLVAYLLRGPFDMSRSSVSAVETGAYIEVYWDQNCSRPVYSIEWGDCVPGQTKDISVYVRNIGSEACVLATYSAGWIPAIASNYISFSRAGEGSKIQPGQAVRITARLTISPLISGISYFSFQAIFEGRKHFLGDLNLDGEVDILDVTIVCAAYESVRGSQNWNPVADLNRDGTVGIYDLVFLMREYGRAS